MSINRNEITKEMIVKAMACKNADELLKLAKAEGYEITKEEAEAYMAEIEDFELDNEQLEMVAGGGSNCWTKKERPLTLEGAKWKSQFHIEMEESIIPINEKEITKEMIVKAMACETPEELREYAKSEGVEISKEEAEAYFAELQDLELDDAMLENAAGGGLFEYVRDTNKKIAKGLQDWIAG